MKASCLINNYNYGQYLGEAIESALAQSEAFDEIIVVDDGSSDSSLEIAQAFALKHSQIKIISQKNQGQLSAFNSGFKHATGELICFLDADDLYATNYLAKLKSFYAKNPACDFVFCAHKRIGEENEKTVFPFAEQRFFGKTQILTLTSNYPWIGAPTSMLSMKRSVLTSFMPFPQKLLPDWITKADDCLIHAAAALKAQKAYFPKPLVYYRRHSSNDSSAIQKIRKDQTYKERQQERSFRFFRWLILTKLLEKSSRRICTLHLLDKFSSASGHSIDKPLLKLQKFKYFFPLLQLLWQESNGLPLQQRASRIAIVSLAYLFNLRGSFNKFY